MKNSLISDQWKATHTSYVRERIKSHPAIVSYVILHIGASLRHYRLTSIDVSGYASKAEWKANRHREGGDSVNYTNGDNGAHIFGDVKWTRFLDFQFQSYTNFFNVDPNSHARKLRVEWVFRHCSNISQALCLKHTDIFTGEQDGKILELLYSRQQHTPNLKGAIHCFPAEYHHLRL